MRCCSNCGATKAREEFSRRQWDGAAKTRRRLCEACVSAKQELRATSHFQQRSDERGVSTESAKKALREKKVHENRQGHLEHRGKDGTTVVTDGTGKVGITAWKENAFERENAILEGKIRVGSDDFRAVLRQRMNRSLSDTLPMMKEADRKLMAPVAELQRQGKTEQASRLMQRIKSLDYLENEARKQVTPLTLDTHCGTLTCPPLTLQRWDPGVLPPELQIDLQVHAPSPTDPPSPDRFSLRRRCAAALRTTTQGARSSEATGSRSWSRRAGPS
jgi:hypothetical protein